MRSAKVGFWALVGLPLAAAGCSFTMGTGTGAGTNYGTYTPPPQQGGVVVESGGQPQQVQQPPQQVQAQAPQQQPILAGVAQPAPMPTTNTGTPRPVARMGNLGGLFGVQQNPQMIPLHGGGIRIVPLLPASTTFGGNSDGRGALRGVLYFLPVNTSQLPDFSTLAPQAVTYTDQLNIPLEDFNEGFPGAPNQYEWFGLRYDGSFKVAATGPYTFHIYSDDGSKVWVDGQLVVNYDGIHLAGAGKAGQINLNAGTHTLRVDYYQALRWTLQLQLFVTPPNGQTQLWSPSF